MMIIEKIFILQDDVFYVVIIYVVGLQGVLLLILQMLMEFFSGNLFGMMQNVGMGWDVNKFIGKEVLIIGIQGGICVGDGCLIVLGYYIGYWEIGMQMQVVVKEIICNGGILFVVFVSDLCDGCLQGVYGMFDFLLYCNDVVIVFCCLICFLLMWWVVIGVVICDKGLFVIMIVLVVMYDLLIILVLGGVMLLLIVGEDVGKVQIIGVCFVNYEFFLQEVVELGCCVCVLLGGGCQFFGMVGILQVVVEVLGLVLLYFVLVLFGQVVWLEIVCQLVCVVSELDSCGIIMWDIFFDKVIENVMVIYVVFGGFINLLLYILVIVYVVGCMILDVEYWMCINCKVLCLVSVLFNGLDYYLIVCVFFVGGVLEVMFYLCDFGLLYLDVMIVIGQMVGENFEWWQVFECWVCFCQCLCEQDGVELDDVILLLEKVKVKGLILMVCFLMGNIVLEGLVIKVMVIDLLVVGEDGVYYYIGWVWVFVLEVQVIKVIKWEEIVQGDIMVVIGGGLFGIGMEEIYQFIFVLKYILWGKMVLFIIDVCFLGVLMGVCFGYVLLEVLVGGLIGKLCDNDIIEIVVDCLMLIGSVNFIGIVDNLLMLEEGVCELVWWQMYLDLYVYDFLLDDIWLWVVLQLVSGGIWKGCIYDIDKIIEVINVGKKVFGI